MRALAAAFALLAAGACAAQEVALQGMLGNRALLIVDGEAPRAVAPGQVHRGVRVLSTTGDAAVVEIGGRRHTLRVGEAPASVGSAGAPQGDRIVLTAARGGHFLAQGSINGISTQFMVDTGASIIAVGAAEAERLGIDFRRGAPVQLNTANGTATGWRTWFARLRVGDVELHGVEAVVTPSPMPYVLLGNSFLNRFQMRRDNDVMVLERRW